MTNGDGDILIVGGVSRSDLGTLGIKSNSDVAAVVSLFGLAGVLDDRLVVLVRSVGKVHADDVKTGITEVVNGLDRVGLGANGANDGGAAVVALRSVGGVEGGKPRDLASEFEVVLSGGGHDALGALVRRSGSHGERRG